MAKSHSIEKLDRNFALNNVVDACTWHDIRDLEIEGRGWEQTDCFYDRLPVSAKGIVRDPVWTLAQHSAGICARFVTDAKMISARWTLRNSELAMDHMPATGVSGLDLYAKHKGQWVWAGTGRPKEFPYNTAVLADEFMPARREFLLYLPLYNGVEAVAIGLPPEAKLLTTPRRVGPLRKGLVFYGTSIVQGGCASRAGMGYPEILGRALDCPTINLGFSGNGWMDLEMAHLLSELEPAAYVIDCIPNMTPARMADRAESFLRILHANRPSTPILLIEGADLQRSMLQTPGTSERRTANAALASVYRRLRKAAADNLFYVSAKSLLCKDNLGTVDGIHPTDLGFSRLAAGIQRAISRFV